MELKIVLIENTWSIGTHGWGNGYVLVPPGHIAHGKDYTDMLLSNIDVHGGLTYSGKATEHSAYICPKELETYWMLGFDTAHYADFLKNWSKEDVLKETKYLKKQLEELESKRFYKGTNLIYTLTQVGFKNGEQLCTNDLMVFVNIGVKTQTPEMLEAFTNHVFKLLQDNPFNYEDEKCN